MDTARLLRRVRLKARLNQEELARRAGTSRPTLSAYERGAKSPSGHTIERLLAAAGMTLDAVPVLDWHDYPIGGERIGWVASRLWRLTVEQALSGLAALPSYVEWVGDPDRDRAGIFDLADRDARARFYRAMLVGAVPRDLERQLDGLLLADLWPELVPHLPGPVVQAWQPVIDEVRFPSWD